MCDCYRRLVINYNRTTWMKFFDSDAALRRPDGTGFASASSDHLYDQNLCRQCSNKGKLVKIHLPLAFTLILWQTDYYGTWFKREWVISGCNESVSSFSKGKRGCLSNQIVRPCAAVLILQHRRCCSVQSKSNTRSSLPRHPTACTQDQCYPNHASWLNVINQ